ncbi:hypothetical protein PR002_g16999 [Phytophthora rubi]|uniref:Uncharacterized protein n=1 Tax=Phytophthora rubi TaxID=129364 RepID=A0A6A3KDM5_9STRA|nr:hypothetical protein PR002_g16999 [Phytophthora rubi]
MSLETLAPIINDLVQSSSEAFFQKLSAVEVVVKQLRDVFGTISQIASASRSAIEEENRPLSKTEDLSNINTSSNPGVSVGAANAEVTSTLTNVQMHVALENDNLINESDEELDVMLKAIEATGNKVSQTRKLFGDTVTNSGLLQKPRCHGRRKENGDAQPISTGNGDDRPVSNANGDDQPIRTGNGDERPISTGNGDDRRDSNANGDDQPISNGNGDQPCLSANGDGQSVVIADGDDLSNKDDVVGAAGVLVNISDNEKIGEEPPPQFSVFYLPKRIQSSRNNSRKRGGTKKLKHPVAVEVSVEEYSKGVPIADVVSWLERSNNHVKIKQVLEKYPVVRNLPVDAMNKVVVSMDKAEGACMSVGVVFGYAIMQNALATLRNDIRISKVVYPRPKFALLLRPDKTPYHE